MGTRIKSKSICARCDAPLDPDERVYCAHCQAVVYEEADDAAAGAVEGCPVCGCTDAPEHGWECPQCGSV